MRAFRLAYDGRPYHGFQRQPDVPTIEDALFDALRALDVCTNEPTNYSAAGRTDAGVSAVAQTVAFDCPDWCTPRALNPELPRSVWTWASADVPAGFHAGLSPTRREYTYHLYAPDADDALAAEAADELSGEHNFHNLTPDESGTVRRLEIDLTREGPYLDLTVTGDGFARQLVRRVVTLVHEITVGTRPLDAVERVLSDVPLDGPDGVAPAPPYPLVLTAVDYDREFSIDNDARRDAREWFETRRIEQATRSRVAGTVTNQLG